jgi:hypothetical protein
MPVGTEIDGLRNLIEAQDSSVRSLMAIIKSLQERIAKLEEHIGVPKP